MKVLLYFLLVFSALLAYMILAVGFGIDQRYPWVHIAIALLGCGLLIRSLREKFTWPRLITSIFSLVLVAFFSWWVFSFSEYRSNEQMAHLGQTLPLQQLERIDQDGKTHLFGQLLAEPGPSLLVFYRGHW